MIKSIPVKTAAAAERDTNSLSHRDLSKIPKEKRKNLGAVFITVPGTGTAC